MVVDDPAGSEAEGGLRGVPRVFLLTQAVGISMLFVIILLPSRLGGYEKNGMPTSCIT